MPVLFDYPKTKPARAPAGPKPIEVTLSLEQPDAHEVFLCGDFNQWSATSLRMIRRPDNGRWEKRLALAPGRYQYKFVVDGEWIHNAGAQENVPNHYGSLNSVLDVHA